MFVAGVRPSLLRITTSPDRAETSLMAYQTYVGPKRFVADLNNITSIRPYTLAVKETIESDDMSGSTSQSTWTKWFDSPPDPDGDSQITENLLKSNGGKICEKGYEISSTECQRNNYLVFNESTPKSYIPDNLNYFCSKEGVWCRNKDQGNDTCGDYSIRYKCKYTTSTSSDSGMFPQFDVRIYIILAVVPILIFIARILWTYICRNRRRRQREERRARRRQQGRYDDDDSSSTSPRASKPPPSYHDIFGEPGHFKTSVFAISRDNLPICPKCSGLPCSVAKVISSPDSRSQKNSAKFVTSGADSSSAVDSVVINSQTGDSSSSSPGHSTGTFQQVDNAAASEAAQEVQNSQEFVEIDLTMLSTSSETGSSTENVPAVSNKHSTTQETHSVDALPPDKSDSTITITINPSTLQAAAISISQPCACVCHRTIPFSHYKNLGYDNMAFAHEVEPAPPLPGMHVPPLPEMHRVWSHVSVITLSELPSYEAALELMNKENKDADAGS